jgi:hypothetical protein
MINTELDVFKEVITEAAYQYVAKLVGGAREQEQLNFNKAAEQHLVTARSFEEAELDFRSFNWHTPERDRNWWWQMQALPFLGWFNSSYSLFSNEQQQAAIKFCLQSLHNWQQQAASGDTSPLVWHDHATAFRLRNIVNWLLICIKSGHLSQLQEADPQLQFIPMIEQHLAWLANDNNYSKHTNHGFDQALVVYSIVMYRSDNIWQRHAEQASARLQDELSFAFTDEGVHKENSPGYHKFMLGRVKTLIGLKELGDTQVSSVATLYVNKATAFLEAITLPNGFLPMIGDTRGSEAGLKTEITEDLKVFDYSKSGYVIVKGRDHKNKEFCLIFKNAHDSHYHRHDDDLSIYLYYDGEVLLGDGGLGSHNEKDPRRIFLRSAKSHNVPYVDGIVAVRSPKKLIQENSTTVYDNLLTGTSYCYGFELKRTVNIKDICRGVVSVEDVFADTDAGSTAINFYSAHEPKISNDNLSVAVSNQLQLTLVKKENTDQDFYCLDDVVISNNYNEYLKAYSYGWRTENNSISYNIFFYL